MKQKNVAVLFGGVNPEHEVSIITALQIMNALQEGGRQVIPIYIGKNGQWFRGDEKYLKPETFQSLEQAQSRGEHYIVNQDPSDPFLKKTLVGYTSTHEQIDVVFPVFHGRNGEDGAIQGFLELIDLPYVGCGITASSVGIDKFVAKRVAQSLGLDVAPDFLITKHEWRKDQKQIIAQALDLADAVYIKPNSLGSSIGISKAEGEKQIQQAIEVALQYDPRVLIEAALTDITEINISIIGNNPYQLSITEQPIGASETLSFEDKYLSSSGKTKTQAAGMASADRHMPAQVSLEIITKVEKSARRFFQAIDGKGIARIDFIYSKDRLYFNEINTLPGSLAFYLWEKTGLTFSQLVSRLVELAEERHSQEQQLITTFQSNILSHYQKTGIKNKTSQ